MRRSLKHGPIAWRTALRWRSRSRLAFAAIAPTVFLPPFAVARFAEVSEIRVIVLTAVAIAALDARAWFAKQVGASGLEVQQAGVRDLVIALPLRHSGRPTLKKPCRRRRPAQLLNNGSGIHVEQL